MVWVFYPDRRVLHWRFTRADITDDDCEALVRGHAVASAGGEPWVLLADATGVRSTSMGYRRTAVELFRGERARMTMLAYNLPVAVRMMCRMVMLAAGLRGGMYGDLDGALAAGGIHDWRPSTE